MPDRTPTGLPYPLPTDQVAGLPATFRELVELIATNVQPTGTVTAFAGAAAPAGWLVCDGTAHAQADLPDLFAVLGTTYNVTDPGPGMFRVPDLRGRTVVGVGADGTPENATGRTIGEKGGDTRMPAHVHDIQRSNVAASSVGTDTSVVYRTLANTGATYTTTQSSGHGGGDNMPPYLALTYIIRT